MEDALVDNTDAVDDAPDNTSEEKTPQTPLAQRISSLDSGTLPDAETPSTSTFSNSGSVIVRSDLSERSPSASQDAFASSLWMDVTNSVPSPGAVVPRKRNSETASLPESVSDSERTYGGYKHRSRPSVDTGTVSSSSSLSGTCKRPSLIPRPVSDLSHVRPDPAKVPLPPKSAPPLETDYKRLDERFTMSPDGQSGKGVQFSELSSPVTPSTLSPAGPGGKGLLHLEGLSKLSTVVSRGSPCDLSALSSETGSSASDVNDENSPPDGVAVVQQSGSSLLPGPGNSPRLVLVNGVFSIRCPVGTEPGAYDVSITILLNLQKGRPRDWLELVVPGLPRLPNNGHGYVYFRTPSNQGIEVRTTHFKRHTLIDSCLMAQFLIPSKIVIPFRLCDAQFYGFLRDFKVTQAIRADVETHASAGSGSCLIKYHAVCSIDLIQRDFWSKQCGFFLYIYGGPQGEFTAQIVQSEQKLPTIHLGSDPDAKIGVSEVQVICAPSNLALFAVEWEVELPGQSASAWMPRIKASLDSGSVEVSLQAEFEEAKAAESGVVVRAEAPVGKSSKPTKRELIHLIEQDQEQRSPPRKKTAWWKTLFKILLEFIHFWNSIYVLYLLAENHSLKTQNKGLQGLYHTLCQPEENGHIELEIVPGLLTVTLPAASKTEVPMPVKNTSAATPTPGSIKIGDTDPTAVPVSPTLPLRDRVDYLLGWRGPVRG